MNAPEQGGAAPNSTTNTVSKASKTALPQMKIRRIRVREGKLDFELEIPLRILSVSERTARHVLSVLPNLARHLCINEKGQTFGDEIVGTELGHLFEHSVIELQGQAYGSAARSVFKGHTSWADEIANTRPQGIALMRTTVTFLDDLVALQAVKDACAIVNWAVRPAAQSSAEAPDVPAMIENLRRMMK